MYVQLPNLSSTMVLGSACLVQSMPLSSLHPRYTKNSKAWNCMKSQAKLPGLKPNRPRLKQGDKTDSVWWQG
uniref:Uncharacterized protein n=1 Tax=Zea mays TaxID=4577 RepID=C0HHG0_MAIZE|nr:unknown [Zea mays]